MKRMRTVTVAIVAAVLSICVATVSVSAASLSELRERISEKKSELEAGKAKERSLSDELNELEYAITVNEEKLDVLKDELSDAQKEVDKQTSNLNDRVRNMYKSGSIGFLDVLLGSDSFSEFLTNLDIVKMIYKSDEAVLGDLEKAQDKVKKKKNEVEQLQNELEASQAVVKEEKDRIAASNTEKEAMLAELQADADRLTAELQRKASSGSYGSGGSYSGGSMAWPVPSSRYITDQYGWRDKHPVTGVSTMHTGLDIGASTGSAIVAANSGTVSRASWYGGYGNCVIINHGGGVSTLYGHCSALYVSPGQSVSRGETIAAVGMTGQVTGPHLHFEVRINGGYTDPNPYLY